MYLCSSPNKIFQNQKIKSKSHLPFPRPIQECFWWQCRLLFFHCLAIIPFWQLELELKDQKNNVTANELFNSRQDIYKDWDYRCLAPYSHKDPTKWKTYEMHDYRKATSEEELKRVDQFEYDNNFFNWEDPKVLQYFTKSATSLQQAWKKTYGFPYSAPTPWNTKTFVLQSTKCWEKCASLEVSSYHNMI